MGWGSERGFREVQRVSEGVQRESEREAIDDDERGDLKRDRKEIRGLGVVKFRGDFEALREQRKA